MLKKPPSCYNSGCPLATKGFGYAPKAGPKGSTIALIGEALGQTEALQGIPFVGVAGGLLDRLLRNANIVREDTIIDNVIRCSPPRLWLDGAPWESEAIHCCVPNLESTLNDNGIKVVVPMGGTAIRRLLGISKRDWKSYKKPMENFHGTVHRDKLDRFWIVPTFHPSYLNRGNMKLFGVVVHDLLLAKNIAENGYEWVEPNLKLDPPIEWFMEWVNIIIEKSLEDEAAGRKLPWLAVDIETPEKAKGVDESEIAVDDPSYIITRVNFATSYDMDFGLTVPWSGPYIDGIQKLLATETLRKAGWNWNYDRPRLIVNGCPIANPLIDIMDCWHMLQPGLPKGLGFVSPFFSKYKIAWKHWSSGEPAKYAAMDGIQTVQCAVGSEKDLIHSGQWSVFDRHGTLVDRYALKPAEEIGLKLEISESTKYNIHKLQRTLNRYRRNLLRRIKMAVPNEIIPLVPIKGYKKQPLDENNTPKPEYFLLTNKIDCYKCLACGKADVTTKHRCKERRPYEEKHGKSPFEFSSWDVSLWFKKGEFNPASPKQVLSYIKFKGHKPGIAKKSHAESSDAATIEKLERKHGGDFYKYLLKLRKIDKVKGTYVDGALKRLDENSRIKCVFTNNPETWRTSAQVFNFQNIISAGKHEDLGLGEKFRKCIVAERGCVLMEVDWSGIEAVEVGWFAGDPQYIRLAKLSTHAYIITHMKEFDDKPADISWSDNELGEYLHWVKHNKKYKKLYTRGKRLVHSGNYAMTPLGLHLTYPEDFPTIRSAKEAQDITFDLFPKIKTWQNSIRKRAHKEHTLGGNDHPFNYRLWFWDVYAFKKISNAQRIARQRRGDFCVEIAEQWFAVYPGKDHKSCVAYLPQSTSAGILRETMLKLFMPESKYCIGEAYYGKTPLRSPIHDSFLLEFPKSKLDFVLENVYSAMTHPIIQQPCPKVWDIGEYLSKSQLDELEKLNLLTASRDVMEKTRYLTIGVDAEVGLNWGSMKDVEL